MATRLDLDLVWGGYYASVSADSKDVTVFRLLDFNQEAYHAALLSETFTAVPSLDELNGLTPFVGHAPIAVRALLNEPELRIVGRKALCRDDFEGYLF